VKGLSRAVSYEKGVRGGRQKKKGAALIGGTEGKCAPSTSESKEAKMNWQSVEQQHTETSGLAAVVNHGQGTIIGAVDSEGKDP